MVTGQMAFACNPETDYATLAQEQAQVREALELIREALALRADFMRLSLAIGINLSAVERRLSEALGETPRPTEALSRPANPLIEATPEPRRPFPTLGGAA